MPGKIRSAQAALMIHIGTPAEDECRAFLEELRQEEIRITADLAEAQESATLQHDQQVTLLQSIEDQTAKDQATIGELTAILQALEEQKRAIHQALARETYEAITSELAKQRESYAQAQHQAQAAKQSLDIFLASLFEQAKDYPEILPDIQRLFPSEAPATLQLIDAYLAFCGVAKQLAGQIDLLVGGANITHMMQITPTLLSAVCRHKDNAAMLDMVIRPLVEAKEKYR